MADAARMRALLAEKKRAMEDLEREMAMIAMQLEQQEGNEPALGTGVATPPSIPSSEPPSIPPLSSSPPQLPLQESPVLNPPQTLDSSGYGEVIGSVGSATHTLIPPRPAPIRNISEIDTTSSVFEQPGSPFHGVMERHGRMSSFGRLSMNALPAHCHLKKQDIQLQGLVGQGSFGMVWKALFQGKTQVAVKLFLYEDVESEIVMLSRIKSHPNVLNFLGVIFEVDDPYKEPQVSSLSLDIYIHSFPAHYSCPY
jgi:hypothetical protein